MTELLNYCRICLQTKPTNSSLYLHVQHKYLPSSIENICGVVISSFDEPQALICKECAEAIISAEDIIQKCQESHKILIHQRKHLQLEDKDEPKVQQHEQWLTGSECKKEIDLIVKREEEELLEESILEEQEEFQNIEQNFVLRPEILEETILDYAVNNQLNLEKAVINECEDSKVCRGRKGLKIKDHEVLSTDKNTENSKPLKKYLRSQEQNLKEPLMLIGETGIVRKRKLKSHLRAIPNFYFRCEFCHEFESNVALNAKHHLITIHGIQRPAIFRCIQCEAKPFMNNQSLMEHIATIHKQNYLEETEMTEESSLKNSWQNHSNSDMGVTREFKDNKIRKRRSSLKVKDLQEVSSCWSETTECKQEIDLGPEMLGESIVEDSCYNKTYNNEKKQVQKYQKLLNSQEESAVLLQQHQKPHKKYFRMYNTIKQPLKLIGDAGMVRKRKPKSHLRAIPNFYYRCEICNEFESNVAKYAKSHLITVHKIERPAIFRCSQCVYKPFMYNQSLLQHIATVHDRQPRKREFKCKECAKAFNRNSHLQRHLRFAHEIGKLSEANNS